MLVVIGLGILTQVFVAITPIEWVNLPNRAYWIAPEHRKQTIGLLGSFAALLFGFVLLTLQAGFELAVSATCTSRPFRRSGDARGDYRIRL